MKLGRDHQFRYHMFVHEGKIDIGRTEQLWNDYAHPPKVEAETTESGDAIIPFGCVDFSHWTAGKNEETAKEKLIEWKRIGDSMKISPRTGSIMTRQGVTDFKMHIEFRTP